MSNSKIVGLARVKLEVEVPTASHWGSDCTVGQIFSQASEEAAQRLRNALGNSGIRIVGEPRVTAILTERE